MPITPRPLPAGGRIRLVSVAGPVDRPAFSVGVARLEARGFEVSWNDAILSTGHPFLAASDEQRLADLVEAFEDPDADAVLCVRGGYGSMRLLPAFDAGWAAQRDKPFAGYSDITALHLALNAAGLVTFHTPVVTALGKMSPEDAEMALDDALAWLTGRPGRRRRMSGRHGVGGCCEGPLVGGNLSLLSACLPIRGLRPPPGAVLLIEDVGEPFYRLDRMTMGLKLGGFLDEVAGVALGSFEACGDGAQDAPDRAAEVVADALGDLGVPIVLGLPIGHRWRDRSVPLGGRVRLDGGAASLQVLW